MEIIDLLIWTLTKIANIAGYFIGTDTEEAEEISDYEMDTTESFRVILSHIKFHSCVDFYKDPLPSTSKGIRHGSRNSSSRRFFNYATADMGIDYDAKHVDHEGIEHSVQLGYYASEPTKKEFIVFDETLCIEEFADSLKRTEKFTNSSYKQLWPHASGDDVQKTESQGAYCKHQIIRVEHKYSENLYYLLANRLFDYQQTYFNNSIDDMVIFRSSSPDEIIFMLDDDFVMQYEHFRNLFYLATHYLGFFYFEYTKYTDEIVNYQFTKDTIGECTKKAESYAFADILVRCLNKKHGPFISNTFRHVNKTKESIDYITIGLLEMTNIDNVIVVPQGYLDNEETCYKGLLTYLYDTKGDCVGFVSFLGLSLDLLILKSNNGE